MKGSYNMYDKKPFITLSREFGSEGWVLAKKIEDKLNTKKSDPPWKSYNKEILAKIEKDEKLSKELVESLDKPADSTITEFFNKLITNKPERFVIFSKMAKVIKSLSIAGNSIIVGRGGCFITHELLNGFHVRVIATMDWRIDQMAKQKSISIIESKEFITKMQKDRDAFIRDYFFTDVSDPHYYDLIINMSRISLEDASDLVIYTMRKKGLIE